MPKFWWVFTLGTALCGCSSLPKDFPENAKSGAGGDLAAGGVTSSAGEGGDSGSAPAPCGTANPLRSQCDAWVACDGCASACACDKDCVSQCGSRLASPIVGDQEADAALVACGSSYVSCFGESLGGVDGAGTCEALVPCCERLAGTDDGLNCQAVVEKRIPARCLSFHLAYLQICE